MDSIRADTAATAGLKPSGLQSSTAIPVSLIATVANVALGVRTSPDAAACEVEALQTVDALAGN
jgi:hypothetical protein